MSKNYKSGSTVLPSYVGLVPRGSINPIAIDRYFPFDRYQEILRPESDINKLSGSLPSALPHFVSVGLRMERGSDNTKREAILNRIVMAYAKTVGARPADAVWIKTPIASYFEFCHHCIILLGEAIRDYRVMNTYSTSDTLYAYSLYRTIKNGRQFRNKLGRSAWCDSDFEGPDWRYIVNESDSSVTWENDPSTSVTRQPLSLEEYSADREANSAQFASNIRQFATFISQYCYIDDDVMNRVIPLTQYLYKDSNVDDAPCYVYTIDHTAPLTPMYSDSKYGELHHYNSVLARSTEDWASLFNLVKQEGISNYAHVAALMGRTYGGKIPGNSSGNSKVPDALISYMDYPMSSTYDQLNNMMLKNASLLPTMVADGTESKITLDGIHTLAYIDNDLYTHDQLLRAYYAKSTASYNGAPTINNPYVYYAGFDLDPSGFKAIAVGNEYRSEKVPLSLDGDFTNGAFYGQIMRWKGLPDFAPQKTDNIGILFHVTTEHVMSIAYSVYYRDNNPRTGLSNSHWVDTEIQGQYITYAVNADYISNFGATASVFSWLESLPLSNMVLAVGDFSSSQAFWPLAVSNVSVNQLSYADSLSVLNNIINIVDSDYQESVVLASDNDMLNNKDKATSQRSIMGTKDNKESKVQF